MREARFYVYEHTRADTGALFYVGKGTGKRAHSASRHHRNAYWQRVTAKAGGFHTRFVVCALDEELAFLAESERIDQLRRLGVKLANLTDGGEGTAGWEKTPEWRAKVGAAHRGKTVSTEVRAKISAAVRASGYTPSAEARERIRQAHLGHTRNVGRVQPLEERRKRAESLRGNRSRTGQTRSAAERQKVSISMKGRRQTLLECPHCGKQGGNAMRRWHFNSCKEA